MELKVIDNETILVRCNEYRYNWFLTEMKLLIKE